MGNTIFVGICFHYPDSDKSLSEEGIKRDIKSFRSFSEKTNCEIVMITDHTFVDKKKFIELIEQIVGRNFQNIFIYFSGHFKSGNIIFPKNESFNYDDFLRMLYEKCMIQNKTSKIFTVLDCCKFSSNILKNKLGHHVEDETNHLEKIHIVAISSSDDHQRSVNKNKGSLFSEKLFSSLLNEELVFYEELKINLRVDDVILQEPQIYSNKPWFCPAIKYSHINRIDIR
jgi:hypothetical protein